MSPLLLKAWGFIGVRGVLIGVISVGVGVLLYVNKDLDAKLDTANLDLATKSAEIVALQNQIDALELASRLDEQEATASYNAAQQSCDRRIQAAVEAVGVPFVNPTPEVPTDAPVGTPPVCDCPSQRLRDVAKPFTAPR